MFQCIGNQGIIGSAKSGSQTAAHCHRNCQPDIPPQGQAARSAAGSGVKVTAPLPGTVVSVKVSVGDKVTAGQTLIVLEAMKMENNIDAVQGGTVKSIDTQAGATVMEGDLLMVIE